MIFFTNVYIVVHDNWLEVYALNMSMMWLITKYHIKFGRILSPLYIHFIVENVPQDLRPGQPRD